jgi:nucleotide-binding universal stress UspA family protein
MHAIRRILSPTDFTELSGHALRTAHALAVDCGGDLYVVHVRQSFVVPDLGPQSALGSVVLAPSDDELDAVLDSFVHRVLPQPRCPVLKRSLCGPVADAVREYARQHAIDLIVMGAHTGHRMRRRLLGSTSLAVFEAATCGVLMVHPPGARRSDGRSRSVGAAREDTAQADPLDGFSMRN